MKLTRTEAREKIMVILYQVDFYIKNKIQYDLEEVIKENLEIDNSFVRNIVNGVLENIESIDKLISKYLENWDFDRLGKTDQAILRMAIYEILYTDTPDIVCINEAVELAKEFSDDKVKNMINAVLDGIMHDKED